MPTYEYRCKDCGTELEVVQSFTDDALTTCEACGGDLRKVFGNVGISFKGSGFYKTDSRNGSSKSDSSSETKSESSGDTKGESKSDAKGEKKADKKPDKAPAASSSSSSSGSSS